VLQHHRIKEKKIHLETRIRRDYHEAFSVASLGCLKRLNCLASDRINACRFDMEIGTSAGFVAPRSISPAARKGVGVIPDLS
jgi:hypothetical protein